MVGALASRFAKGYQHFVRNRSLAFFKNFPVALFGFVLARRLRLFDPYRREMLRPTGQHSVTGG